MTPHGETGPLSGLSGSHCDCNPHRDKPLPDTAAPNFIARSPLDNARDFHFLCGHPSHSHHLDRRRHGHAAKRGVAVFSMDALIFYG